MSVVASLIKLWPTQPGLTTKPTSASPCGAHRLCIFASLLYALSGAHQWFDGGETSVAVAGSRCDEAPINAGISITTDCLVEL
jgi:hypothetical protein